MTSIADDAFIGSEKMTISAPEGSYAYDWAVANDCLDPGAILESDHPYASGTEQTWEYAHEDEDVYALAITFSKSTYMSYGDTLTISDAAGNETVYESDALSGKTIAIIGNSFTLQLAATSYAHREYGFVIIGIEALTEEEYNAVVAPETTAEPTTEPTVEPTAEPTAEPTTSPTTI